MEIIDFYLVLEKLELRKNIFNIDKISLLARLDNINDHLGVGQCQRDLHPIRAQDFDPWQDDDHLSRRFFSPRLSQLQGYEYLAGPSV